MAAPRTPFDGLDGFDREQLRRLEAAAPVPPYEALSAQLTACSLGVAPPTVVVWEQQGPAQALYLPPAPCFDVLLPLGPGRPLLEQFRLGQASRGVCLPDLLVIVPPHVPAYFRSHGPVHHVHVSIAPEALQAAAPGCGAAVRLRNCFGESDPAAAALAAAALQQLHGTRPPAGQVLERIHDALVAHLVDRYAERFELPRGRLSPCELRRLADYVHEHLSDALTLCGMADLLGQSPFHFSRRFKRTTGMSPMRYVVELRLERARQLLHTGSLSVLDIALETGFADGSHLTRWYRRKYGHPPTHARAARSA